MKDVLNGKDAEVSIRKAFFPKSSAALDDKDHETLAKALPVEKWHFANLVGPENATLFAIQYDIGLRRLTARSKK